MKIGYIFDARIEKKVKMVKELEVTIEQPSRVEIKPIILYSKKNV